jgi:hypothetical protein
VNIGNGLLGALRQRLPVMPNNKLTDGEIERGQGVWFRRAVWSAIILTVILLFEACVLFRFGQGKDPWETGLLIATDVGLALAVAGEIIGDLMAHGFQAIADGRSKERVAAAEERAAEANKKAREAGERAAKAELELVKYRARRSMTPDDMQQIADRLRGFGPLGFDICISAGDSEIFHLMDQISVIGAWAGWTWRDWPTLGGLVYDGDKMIGSGNALLNVAICHRFDALPSVKEAAVVFANALTSVGIGAYDHILGSGAPIKGDADTVHIRIGRKT